MPTLQMMQMMFGKLNLLANGDFSSSGTNWSFDTGGSFTGFKANFTGAADQKLLYTPTIAFVAGATYEYTMTFSSWSSGSLKVQFIGGTVVETALFSGPASGNGTVTGTLVAASGNTQLRITGNAGTPTFSIDDIFLAKL